MKKDSLGDNHKRQCIQCGAELGAASTKHELSDCESHARKQIEHWEAELEKIYDLIYHRK